MKFTRIKNRLLSMVATRIPWVADRLVQSASCKQDAEEIMCDDVPWSPPKKSLSDSRVAVVTTAGLHHAWQTPFDMDDTDGDPTSREIQAIGKSLIITHDYYDHTDAEQDHNIVFPLERLKELADEGVIGEVAPLHYSFMGHITGKHVQTLIEKTAPEVARLLKEQEVDIVLLTPG